MLNCTEFNILELHGCELPGEQINSRFSNSQNRRIRGTSGAILYWGFLGVLMVSSSASITCMKIHFLNEITKRFKFWNIKKFVKY